MHISDGENMTRHLGFYKHGNLPHYDAAMAYQMITFRLGDSLPLHVIDRLKHDFKSLSESTQKTEYRKRIEKYLDSGHGCSVLKERQCAVIIEDALKFYHNKRYSLIAWVVMPNHVHAMIRQFDGWQVGEVVKSWKSYSSKLIRQNWTRAGLPDPFWQRGYWDRCIRDEKHFQKALEYILDNPVKAGFAEKRFEWEFSGYFGL